MLVDSVSTYLYMYFTGDFLTRGTTQFSPEPPCHDRGERTDHRDSDAGSLVSQWARAKGKLIAGARAAAAADNCNSAPGH